MRKIISMIVCAAMMISIALAAIPAGAAEASLTTDKSVYYVGEPIYAEAASENANGTDWIGVAIKGHEDWGTLRWVYTKDLDAEYDIRKSPNAGTSGKFDPYQTFPAGEYVLYLLPDDISFKGNLDKALAKVEITIINDTSNLKVPNDVSYYLYNLTDGFAEGVVAMTVPEGHGAESVYIWWGSEGEKLSGYAPLTCLDIPENEGAFRFQYEIPEGTVIPPEASELILRAYSEENGFSERAVTVEIPEGSAYVLPDGEALAEFEVIGDLRVSGDGFGALSTVLGELAGNSPASDGVFVVGDVFEGKADAALWEQFWQICKDVGGSDIYLGMGDAAFDGADSYMDAVNSFFGSLSLPEDADRPNGAPYYDVMIGDYLFIFMGSSALPDGDGAATVGEAQYAWLEEKLESYADGTPIFLFMHWALDPASEGGIADGERLEELLEKYPEVVLFSSGDERSDAIFDTERLEALADGEPVTGYYVKVYADRILLLARDFASGQWLPEACVALEGRVTREDTNVKTLESVIAQAENLKKEEYQSYTWENMTDALENAREALSAPTQAEVDSALEALREAISELKSIEKVDITVPEQKPTDKPEDGSATDAQASDSGEAEKKEGCGSAIGAGTIALICATVALSGALARRKRER